MPTGIVERFTGMQAVIQSDHAYIHEGVAYKLFGNSGSIAASGVEHISFKTPSANKKKYIHLRPVAFSSTANIAQITIVENAVMTSGTAATPRNLNRNKKDASLVSIATGATLTTAGNGGTIFSATVGTGGNPANSTGGASGSEHEIVLKPDTMYSITMANIGATTATVVYYTLFWYEEGNGA